MACTGGRASNFQSQILKQPMKELYVKMFAQLHSVSFVLLRCGLLVKLFDYCGLTRKENKAGDKAGLGKTKQPRYINKIIFFPNSLLEKLGVLPIKLRGRPKPGTRFPKVPHRFVLLKVQVPQGST